MKKRVASSLGAVVTAIALTAAGCNNPPTNSGEHRVSGSETSRDVHVFVLGDSWSVDAAAPLQLAATKDYSYQGQDYVGVKTASSTGAIGAAGKWGYASEWVHSNVLGGTAGNVVEVSNFALGGVTVRAWLHPDGPCSGTAPVNPVLTDGCFEESPGIEPLTTVPDWAPDYYRLDNVVNQIESVDSAVVPLVYVSLGAGDLGFYQDRLMIGDAAQRDTRLAEIEAQLGQLVTQLRAAHPRAEVVIAGYTNFSDQTILAGPDLQPANSVFDFGTCDPLMTLRTKRSRMINSVMNGYGNPAFGCYESGDRDGGEPAGSDLDLVGGLDGVYRRIDRATDAADSSDRVHFSSRDHSELWPNWTMFSHADTAETDKGSPSCVLKADGFHLRTSVVPSGCDNARGVMNPAKTFAIETACDWRLITEAFV